MGAILTFTLVSVAIYVALNPNKTDFALPDIVLAELHVEVRGHQLVVEDEVAQTVRYFHFRDLDHLAIRTRGGRRAFEIRLEFGPDRLRLREGTPGLDDVVDYIIGTPPPGLDLSRFGEAMESRARRDWVLLDRRKR